MSYLSVGVMGLLTTVFAFSFAGKIRAPRELVRTVRPLTSERMAPLLAVAVIVLEGVVPLAFAASAAGTRWAAALGLLLSGGLLIAFTWVMRGRPRGSRCHCFGERGAPYSTRHAVRNLLLAAAAVAGFVEHDRVAGSQADGVVAAAVCGLVLGLLVVMMDDLIDLFRTE